MYLWPAQLIPNIFNFYSTDHIRCTSHHIHISNSLKDKIAMDYYKISKNYVNNYNDQAYENRAYLHINFGLIILISTEVP